ncbi:MAG TPA: hypothetical protein VF170_17150 [Planctomycetaceae bacterium]
MSRRHLLFGLFAFVGGLVAASNFGPQAAAQFGGGGFGPGVEIAEPPAFTGGQLIQGGGFAGVGHSLPGTTMFFVASPDKTRLWGYSTEKGEWKPVALSGESGPPILGLSVAAVADGRKVHGFSAFKGEWDTLELPEDSDPQPVVGSDYAQVRTDERVAVFSGRTGKWATVKFAEQ